MAGKFLTNWTDDDARALAAWQARCAALGIDILTGRTIVRGSGRERVKAPSDSAAVRAALKCATACRCGEHESFAPDACDHSNRVPLSRGGYWQCMTCSAFVTQDGKPRSPDARTVVPEPNPLRSLREGAGLSQKQMADKLGVSKRAVQLQEARASASPEMVARARRAIGGGR